MQEPYVTDSVVPRQQSSYSNSKLGRVLAEHEALTASLRQSEHRLSRAQEIAHVGSWELDLVSNRLSWSDEVYRIFGLRPQEFGATYQAFLDAVHPDDRPAVDAAYCDSVREGRDAYEIEHRVIRKSTGEVRIVHEKCEHIRDASGRIIYSIGMVQDITERKRVERALRDAQAKLKAHAEDLEKTVASRTAKLQEVISDLEHFSYAMVHDLRAPLRAMKGFTNAIEEDCAGCNRSIPKEYSRRIKVAANRMDQLIADSLNYSKAMSQELPLRPVDLGELLQGLVETYPNLLPDEAEIQIAAGMPTVLGNEAALTQCFSNLLGNAVKFTKPGAKPQIRVWAEPVHSPLCTVHSRPDGDSRKPETKNQQPGSHSPATLDLCPPARSRVRVWVEDNGIGIPKPFHHRIFGMFERATTGHEGTGIGLAVARKVVERMGGKIGVESEEGKGSRFWLELKTGGAQAAGIA